MRFQFLDLEVPRGLIAKKGDNTQTFDADALDREDYFIAELEKRGIYIDFNLLVGRPFRAGDGVKDAELLREGAKRYIRSTMRVSSSFRRTTRGNC